MPIANPGWISPEYSFAIREERMQAMVDEVRAAGVDLVVCLSHNGFDAERKMAGRVKGIDVILTDHTHDAVPEPIVIGETIMIASGSNGKFVSRIDLDVRNGNVMGFRHKPIPIFATVITPDAEMAALIDGKRASFNAQLEERIGTTASLLYRRGNFNGTWDDLICNAIRSERDTQIAMSPGVKWGTNLKPGDAVSREDIHNVTSMTYGNCYRTEMTGETIHTILEDVADNLFNPDGCYQQGGDLVRVGGLGSHIDVSKPIGERIRNLTLVDPGGAMDAAKS